MASDRKPLLAYLRMQEGHDRQMMYTLKRSVSRIERELARLERKQGIGAEIRRAQLRQSQSAIKREIAALWRLMGSEVKAQRALAAARSMDVMLSYEAMLWRAVMSKKDVDTLMRAARAQAARQIDIVESRVLGYSRIPLSERVYKSRQLASGQIDRIIDEALARGVSARELADAVREHIRLDTPGGVRYSAMRLGRTELNNAFHATAVRHANRAPWVTNMRWNISGSHPKPDECDDYADIGLFKPEEVPPKPHPNCLCYVTPEVVSRDEFIDQYMSGAYDSVVDEIMRTGSMTF